MNAPKMSAPIGLREAVQFLGRTPTKVEVQKLRRTILAREVIIQDKIMVQTGARSKFQTTLAILKSRMPDLFADEDTSRVADALADLKEEMNELRYRQDILNAKLEKALNPK